MAPPIGLWIGIPLDSQSVQPFVPPPGIPSIVEFLLLEGTGSPVDEYVLLETGDMILLESSS